MGVPRIAGTSWYSHYSTKRKIMNDSWSGLRRNGSVTASSFGSLLFRMDSFAIREQLLVVFSYSSDTTCPTKAEWPF
jgi:hypothetical protein